MTASEAASLEQPADGIGRTRSVAADFARVLVWPTKVLGASRSGSDAAKLLVTLVTIDFILSLLLLPIFVAELRKIVLTTPNVSSSVKVSSIAVAVIISTTLNTALSLLLAMLLQMVYLIEARSVAMARLVAMFLLSNAPAIIDRALRVAAVYLHLQHTTAQSLLPLRLVVRFPANPVVSDALSYFSLFDVWTMVLVVVGLRSVEKIPVLHALMLALVFWGGLQLLLFRLHQFGVVGS